MVWVALDHQVLLDCEGKLIFIDQGSDEVLLQKVGGSTHSEFEFRPIVVLTDKQSIE
jgi:hypothetical protein